MPEIPKIENSFISSAVNPWVETRSVYRKNSNQIKPAIYHASPSCELLLREKVYLEYIKNKWKELVSARVKALPIQWSVRGVASKMTLKYSPWHLLLAQQISTVASQQNGLYFIDYKVKMNKGPFLKKSGFMNYLFLKNQGWVHSKAFPRGKPSTPVPVGFLDGRLTNVWQEMTSNPQMVLSFHRSVLHMGISSVLWVTAEKKNPKSPS